MLLNTAQCCLMLIIDLLYACLWHLWDSKVTVIMKMCSLGIGRMNNHAFHEFGNKANLKFFNEIILSLCWRFTAAFMRNERSFSDCQFSHFYAASPVCPWTLSSCFNSLFTHFRAWNVAHNCALLCSFPDLLFSPGPSYSLIFCDVKCRLQT